MCNILNACIKYCYFPSKFKLAKTIRILKPGKNPCEPSLLTLLNIIGKVFEKLLYTRLQHFIEEIYMYHKTRCGKSFRYCMADALIFRMGYKGFPYYLV